MMAATLSPNLCYSALAKLPWHCAMNTTVRRSVSPCVRWFNRREFSTLHSPSKNPQYRYPLLLYPVITAAPFLDRLSWVPVTGTAFLRLRSSYISEPGSLPESPAIEPVKLVEDDLQNLYVDIHKELRTDRQHLHAIASYYFDGQGKAIRPLMIVLMSRALNTHILGNEALLLPTQRKLALAVEMIHTATLLHDDVIDSSDMRRGKPSVNVVWNQQKAILVGDYVISVASQIIARLRNEAVVSVMATVLKDLVIGEFMQMNSKETENERFASYLMKTFRKTASLLANGCKSVAILGNGDETLQELAFQYGRNVGIAFQLVDDLLDFVSSPLMLGKPSSTDLKLGLATAPVLFACEKFPELEQMIRRRFSKAGDVQNALEAVMQSDGLAQTKFLAEQHCHEAMRYVQQLTPSAEQKALCTITNQVLNRMK